MNWRDFIFSNQSKHRIRRYLVCWLLWWAFIVFTVFFTESPPVPRGNATQSFAPHQPGLEELGFFSYSLLVLLKSFLLVPIHIFFCHSIIDILLPKFQLKKNYWILISGILLVCAMVVPVGYFLYTIVYPSIDNLFNLHLAKPDKFIGWRSIDAGLLNAIKVTLIAVAITFLKHWWLKQKEKDQLEREKIDAEFELLKAQIHPAFLFSTLNNITTQARLASPKAPEMLIKLSDLLSYMLYECDAPKVKLEKEISMLKEYISLEKIRQGDRLEMTFKINGNLNGQMISPLLLLPFIDNSFSYCNKEKMEHAWVNLDITIQDNRLSMKLINGMPTGSPDDTINNEDYLANVKKRLQLLYPGKHELRINTDQELLMVYLNLNLEDIAGEKPTVVEITKPVLSHA